MLKVPKLDDLTYEQMMQRGCEQDSLHDGGVDRF